MTDIPPPNQRPTAMQLAAQASGADPWACPRCGSKLSDESKVSNSYMVSDGRNRRRICVHCHQGFIRTTEIPVPDGFKAVAVPVE